MPTKKKKRKKKMPTVLYNVAPFTEFKEALTINKLDLSQRDQSNKSCNQFSLQVQWLWFMPQPFVKKHIFKAS